MYIVSLKGKCKKIVTEKMVTGWDGLPLLILAYIQKTCNRIHINVGAYHTLDKQTFSDRFPTAVTSNPPQHLPLFPPPFFTILTYKWHTSTVDVWVQWWHKNTYMS